MAETTYLNGIGTESMGLRLVEGNAALDGLPRTRDMQALPGRSGSMASPFSTTEPRVLRFAYYAAGAPTTAQRMAIMDDFADALVGLVEVRVEDGTARVMRGVCRVYQASIASPTFVNTQPTIVVEIVCANGARYDAEPSLLILGTTAVQVPVGTVGHGGYFVYATTGTTPFTISYRNVGGVLLKQMSITPNLTTGQSLILDLDRRDLIAVGATGTRTRVKSQDNAPTQWINILPRDAARASGVYATLESTVPLAYYFRRNWEN